MQAIACHHIYGDAEQILQICNQPGGEPCIVGRTYFHQKIYIALLIPFSARNGAENTQVIGSMFSSNFKDFLALRLRSSSIFMMKLYNNKNLPVPWKGELPLCKHAIFY